VRGRRLQSFLQAGRDHRVGNMPRRKRVVVKEWRHRNGRVHQQPRTGSRTLSQAIADARGSIERDPRRRISPAPVFGGGRTADRIGIRRAPPLTARRETKSSEEPNNLQRGAVRDAAHSKPMGARKDITLDVELFDNVDKISFYLKYTPLQYP
jgi:hypothetical protein